MINENFKKLSSFLSGFFSVCFYISIAAAVFLLGMGFFWMSKDRFTNFRIDYYGLSFNINEMVFSKELFASYILGTAVLILTIFWLKKIFSNIKKEKIFVKENFSLMSKLSLNIMIMSVIQGTIDFFNGRVIAEKFIKEGSDYFVNFRININLLILAVIIFVFAQILKMAADMKEENDLTI